MQDETQSPSTEAAAQEPNSAPGSGAAANPGGSEGLGQEQPSGEGPAAAPSNQGGSPLLGVDETGPPTRDVNEIEMPPDPLRTPPPGPVEQEAPPLVEEPGPDKPSATGQTVEPPGSEAAPIVEGEASREAAAYDFADAAADATLGMQGVTDAAALDAAALDAAALDAAEDTLRDAAAEDAASAFEGAEAGASSTVEGVGSFADGDTVDPFQGLLTAWNIGAEAAADLAEDVGEAAADVVEDVGEAVGDAVDVVGDKIEDKIEDIPFAEDVVDWVDDHFDIF